MSDKNKSALKNVSRSSQKLYFEGSLIFFSHFLLSPYGVSTYFDIPQRTTAVISTKWHQNLMQSATVSP